MKLGKTFLEKISKPVPEYNGRKLTRQEMENGVTLNNMSPEDRAIALQIMEDDNRAIEQGINPYTLDL